MSRLFRALKMMFRPPQVVLTIAGGCILAAILWHLVRGAIAERTLAHELEKIRAKGEPASLQELGVKGVPDEDNGALIYSRAFLILNQNEAAEPPGWDLAFCKPEKPFAEVRADFEAVLKLQAKAMELAREAAAKPRCVFDLDYSQGLALYNPDLVSLRHLGRLFAAESVLRAHSGRADDALESAAEVLRLVHALDDEPLATSKLIQIRLAGIGVDAIERTERITEPSDSVRKKTAALLGEIDFANNATRALMSDRILVLQDWDWSSCVGPRWGRSFRRLGLKGKRYARSEEKVHALRLMTSVVQTSRMAPWVGLRKVRSIESETAADPGRLGIFRHLLFPGLAGMHVQTCRGAAIRDTAVLGLSCELYRSKHGRYPGKLDNLTPELLDKLPPDPFTGKPFVYKLKDDGKGFIVYSVGENLKDDGGVGKRSSDKDDIAWGGGRGADEE